MNQNLTHGSLFSGIGGVELGAKMCGIPTIWNCEIVDFNRQVLKKLFPNTKQYADIKELHHPEPVDIISGGFPCQNISRAASKNRTGIYGEKSGLWQEMLRICDELRPKYVLIENSPDLKHKGLSTILGAFADIGYDAEWQTLSGYQFGIPQRRKRLYVILHATSLGNGLEEREIFARWNKPVYPAWRDSEPKVYGVADVIPDRVAKHRGFGNAVQPLVASYLFACIKHHHETILREKQQNQIT